MFYIQYLFWIFLLFACTRCQAIGDITGKLKCSPLNPPHYGKVSYSLNNETVKCVPWCPFGTTAVITCDEFFSLKGKSIFICQENGFWNSEPSTCVPDCGRRNPEVSLIVYGKSVSPGYFPWHVAIYNTADQEHEFWCGGSLISQFAVLTAAHCTWKVNPKKIIIAFGKYHRELNFDEPHAQMIEASRIEALESYQDATGNYNGDISVIFLKKSVEINPFVRPVCLDWDHSHIEEQLTDGSMGTVLGWGLTENDTFSDYVKVVELPVTSDIKCIAQQERDFRKFVTFTSFCAGFANGTGVCNGDSGGGLSFWDEKSQRWYLQGLVSVSPRKKGTPHCDPHYYTVFTKVSLFLNWLKKLNIYGAPDEKNKTVEMNVGTHEGTNETKIKTISTQQKRDPYQLIRKFFNKNGAQTPKTEDLTFPHSQKMLKFLNV